jgi:hypothetical protein
MDYSLTRTRIRAGQYEGVLSAHGRNRAVPEIAMVVLGEEIGLAKVVPNATEQRKWIVQARIPGNAIGDGVSTILFKAKDTGEVLDSLAIVAGQALDDDLRAELALLRAELDLLKSAFRQHCAATEKAGR